MNASAMIIEMTTHARQRCSQRSVSSRKIQVVIENIRPRKSADSLIFTVRKKDIISLLEKGIISKQEADKLQFLIVVTDFSRSNIITAYYASEKTFKKKIKQKVFF